MTPPLEVPAPVAPKRRGRFALALAAVALVAVAAVGFATGRVPNPFAGSRAKVAPPEAQASAPTAKVIAPRRAASVPITMEQLANVEPYYRADLRARASGIVRQVNRDIGEKVKAGDVLIEIDVPDAEQDVARGGAMVLQRRQELKVSEANLKDAQALRDVSAATIKQRAADVDAATATSDFRKRKFERLKELAAKGTVVGSVVGEEEREYLASAAAVLSAKANVERARADFAESESKVEAAGADIELKKSADRRRTEGVGPREGGRRLRPRARAVRRRRREADGGPRLVRSERDHRGERPAHLGVARRSGDGEREVPGLGRAVRDRRHDGAGDDRRPAGREHPRAHHAVRAVRSERGPHDAGGSRSVQRRRGRVREVARGLVVVARQAEFGNAARVRVAPSDW
jgi:hypothetical protein